MTTATIVLQAMTFLALTYAIVCSRASRWHSEQAVLWRTDPVLARRQKSTPPSVRIHGAVSRTLTGRRA